MSELFLTSPVGLAALSAVAVVVVIYLFYERHRKRTITGLFLWEAPPAWMKGGRRVSRPRRSRSLLLDLLAILLIALALAGPTMLSQTGSNLAIVLDSSLSMRASENHLEARKRALQLMGKFRGEAALVILAGKNPRVVSSADSSVEECIAAIESYDPYSNGDSLDESLSLARTLLPGRATVHVFTDKEVSYPSLTATQIHTHVLRGKLPNLALTEASRIPAPEGNAEQLHVTASNFSTEKQTARFSVVSEGAALHQETIQLEAKSSKRIILQIEDNVGPVTVLLESEPGSDALPDDNKAVLLAPSSSQVTYSIEDGVGGRDALLRALRASGAVPALPKTTPHLLVTNAPDRRGAVATLLIPRPTESSATFTGPFVVDTADPLCRDVGLDGVYWTAARTDTAGGSGLPLVTAGDVPLYFAEGQGRFQLNLDLNTSNIVRTTAWPVIISNLVDKVRQERPGLSRVNYRSAEPVRFIPMKSSEPTQARLVGETETVPWHSPLNPPLLPERPGIYRIEMADDSWRLAINPLAPQESDLSALAAKSADDSDVSLGLQAGALSGTPLAWILMLLGLALAGLNWFLTGRE